MRSIIPLHVNAIVGLTQGADPIAVATAMINRITHSFFYPFILNSSSTFSAKSIFIRD